MVSGKDVWADDFMGRKPSSDFLTNYMLANEHVKVLNVNSPWGAGKTFFLERWKAELSKEHVCVFFNAWETDYSAEPLLALVTCIEQQTKDKLDITASEAGRRAVDVTAGILKKSMPLIAKGLVRKYVGVDLDELIGDGTGDDVADSASELVTSLITDQAKTSRQVEDFKAAVVERLSSAAENNGLKKPAFIFIDELDRCRPTYAIELLERIKHFFELEGCRFIIASDSKQLAHSIRAVYGQGFSSEQYLNRFFDSEFNLDNSNIFFLVHRSLPDIKSVKLEMNVSGRVGRNYFDDVEVYEAKKHTVTSMVPEFTENQLIVVGLCRYFKVELRELSNYIRQIKSAADTIGGNVQFFWLAYLVFFKASKAEEYQDLKFSDKWRAAVASFDKAHGVMVTFSFSVDLPSIPEMALFYLTMLNSDAQELRVLSTQIPSWRSVVYYSLINGDGISTLSKYRDVVELAHRLS
ncbi:KAP family P-loop NTPase fold protein [Pseudomonas azotoformans]